MDEPPLQNVFMLLLIVLLMLLSAFFSASETAFSSLNRIRVRNKAEGGSKRAALVLRLYDNYDRLISTILVGNNIVNLSAASASAYWFIRLFGDVGASVSAVVITVAVIFFGEITPKSLAKESPEAFAMAFAPFLRACIVILMPFSLVFIKWKRFMGRFMKTSNDDQAITEEELLTYVDEAEQDGAIDKEDKELIHNAIEFSDLRAEEILTPRMHIVGIEKDSPAEAITALFLETGYSRLPVYDDTLDNIVGMVHLRDFFGHIQQSEAPLSGIITPAVYVAPSISVNDLLRQLQKDKSHMAVITDEYGGTMGIVTMEDILEELVGEIWDENDEIVEEFIPLDEGGYKVICAANVEHMFDFFRLSPPEEVHASTIGGWIMHALGRIPEEGDTLTYERLTFTVHRVENRRVLECLVTETAEETEAEKEKENDHEKN